jgi:ubiquinone/menaquinone biosynthesis C-methylase UbiE
MRRNLPRQESDPVPGIPASISRPEIVVPPEVFQLCADSVGAFFEPICLVDRQANARDFLDMAKSFKRVDILRRYTSVESRKVLEVGSGFGTNLAVWLKHFGIDAYGAEPGGEGFNQGYVASRMLLTANGLDQDRVVSSTGESLPFADESFDIVYSSNVLEHTENPEQVLRESFRVLRNGGLLHMEIPNFLSYFEGHYMVVQPPIFWKPMLAWWVKLVFRRDPAFARTLQTKINPLWCRRTIRELGKTWPLELISLGDDLFLERLSQTFVFEMQMVASRLERLIRVLRKVNRANWVGRLIVALQGHYPIYLTVRKGSPSPVASS